MLNFLSPNEIAQKERQHHSQERIRRLLQVRHQSNQNSIKRTSKYTETLASEYDTKLRILRGSYESAKKDLVKEIIDEYSAVDVGRGMIDAEAARNLVADRRHHDIQLEITRQATQLNLNNIAATSLKREVIPRYLEVERERARQIVARHKLTLVDPVWVEPKRTSSRPLGKQNFTNTDHHRSVAVVRTKPYMTADVAAGDAAEMAEARRKEAEGDKKSWKESSDERFSVAVEEIARQKNKTRLLKTLGDIRAQDVKRKQANGVLIKSSHSLYGEAQQRVAKEAFNKRFIIGGAVGDSKPASSRRTVRRDFSEESSIGSIGFVRF